MKRCNPAHGTCADAPHDCHRASSQHGKGFQKNKKIYIHRIYNRPHLAGHPARVKVFFFDWVERGWSVWSPGITANPAFKFYPGVRSPARGVLGLNSKGPAPPPSFYGVWSPGYTTTEEVANASPAMWVVCRWKYYFSVITNMWTSSTSSSISSSSLTMVRHCYCQFHVVHLVHGHQKQRQLLFLFLFVLEVQDEKSKLT